MIASIGSPWPLQATWTAVKHLKVADAISFQTEGDSLARLAAPDHRNLQDPGERIVWERFHWITHEIDVCVRLIFQLLQPFFSSLSEALADKAARPSRTQAEFQVFLTEGPCHHFSCFISQ